MKEHWIWLTALKGLGPVGQRKLLEYFGSAEAVFEASPRDLERAGVPAEIRKKLENRSLDRGRTVLRDCAAGGIRVLTLPEPDFPAALRDMAGAPVVLYLRGSLPDLEQSPGIALVGAREANPRALELARQLGWQVAGCGGVVITGMAKGVDAASAWGALDQGGAVIGVLGCGPDVVYPRQSAELYARVARQGCLVSEYPPGTRPDATRFPARNRIISALSVGVVVVRAARRSGALITARFALEQNRDVYTVPGDPDDPLSAGCLELLRSGAVPARNGWEIVSEYEYRYPGAVREYHGRPPAPEPDRSANAQKPARASASKPGSAAKPGPAAEPDSGSGPESAAKPEPAAKAVSADLSPLQRQIVEALSGGPVQLDALIASLDLPAARVLPQLTLLQIKGLIACQPGKYYTLV